MVAANAARRLWLCASVGGNQGLPQRLYARNLRSAFVWAVAIPLLIISIAIIAKSSLALILLPVLYGLQILRIAAKSEQSGRMRLRRAELLFLAKFPEALGAIRYFAAGKNHTIPEYKSNA